MLTAQVTRKAATGDVRGPNMFQPPVVFQPIELPCGLRMQNRLVKVRNQLQSLHDTSKDLS